MSDRYRFKAEFESRIFILNHLDGANQIWVVCKQNWISIWQVVGVKSLVRHGSCVKSQNVNR